MDQRRLRLQASGADRKITEKDCSVYMLQMIPPAYQGCFLFGLQLGQFVLIRVPNSKTQQKSWQNTIWVTSKAM